MSLVILTKYAKVQLKQIEIRIITNALDIFKNNYDKEDYIKHRYTNKPTESSFEDLKNDVKLLNDYFKSYRFCTIKKPNINTYTEWGEEINCRFTKIDIHIIIDILKNYLKNGKIEKKPKHEIENPTMYRIFTHHVIELLNDIIVINNAMESKRFEGVIHSS